MFRELIQLVIEHMLITEHLLISPIPLEPSFSPQIKTYSAAGTVYPIENLRGIFKRSLTRDSGTNTTTPVS